MKSLSKILAVLVVFSFMFVVTAHAAQYSRIINDPHTGTTIIKNEPPANSTPELTQQQLLDKVMFIAKDFDGVTYGQFNLDFEIEGGQAELVRLFFVTLRAKGISHAVIEITSPGGEVAEALKMKAYIEEYQNHGMLVTTKIYCFSASAASFLFLAANDRQINPEAIIMFHEIEQPTYMSMQSPSVKEDEAGISRFIQDDLNEYIASRCKLSKDQMDQLVYKRELWINGRIALQLGIATSFIK